MSEVAPRCHACGLVNPRDAERCRRCDAAMAATTATQGAGARVVVGPVHSGFTAYILACDDDAIVAVPQGLAGWFGPSSFLVGYVVPAAVLGGGSVAGRGHAFFQGVLVAAAMGAVWGVVQWRLQSAQKAARARLLELDAAALRAARGAVVFPVSSLRAIELRARGGSSITLRERGGSTHVLDAVDVMLRAQIVEALGARYPALVSGSNR